jgi:outer membrane protein assembly factor BamB
MAISLLALPAEKQSATAQITTYPYIGAVPNPAGVGQDVLLHIGNLQQLNSAEQGWEGLSVTIERPDGDTDTIDDIRTDSTGGTGRTYVPDIEGTYYLQTHFPTQNLTDFWGVESQYLAGDSEVLELVVTAEWPPVYPGHALPTEYWTRPIDPQLREWSVIAGNWLETPDNKLVVGQDYAPETAHVLWTEPFTTGGLVGENLGQHSFEIGDAYEGKWSNRLIMAGKLYFNKYANPDASPDGTYVTIVCMDLHTGEELWERTLLNNLTMDFGQHMYWDTYDYHGVYDYIWAEGNRDTRNLFGIPSDPLCAFDPWTGDFQWAFYDMPDGDRLTGPKGEIMYLDVDLEGGYMTLWNSSAVVDLRRDDSPNSMGYGQWKAPGKLQNATDTCRVTPDSPLGINGYMWNVTTIPTDLPEDTGVLKIFEGDRVIGGSVNQTHVILWGLNLDPDNGVIGREIFRNTWTAPAYWEEGSLTLSGFSGGFKAFSNDPYLAVVWIKESREHYGFSLEDGDNMWGPTPSQYYLDAVEDSPDDVRSIAYNKFYSGSVGGIVYCYDALNGSLLWTYEAEDPYSEYLFSNNWWLKILLVTDGKIYCGSTEHSPIDPRPRGAPFICLDAETGEEIWRVNGMFRSTRWGGRAIMGDSIIATQDTYDQRVYAIGKGPSATTVSAGPEVTVHGSSVVVKGMVTDISPGTNSAGLQMRFTNGVPAVCDDNMSDWMLYVYKQFEKPADAMGVEVVVSVLDPNGNTYEVGTTTSDASGYFGCEFTPLVPGFYKVIATFAGSGAYYGSYAETFINVEEAPQPTPTPTPTPAPMTDTYVLGIGAGAIIAIVVIGLVIILMLRRR